MKQCRKFWLKLLCGFCENDICRTTNGTITDIWYKSCSPLIHEWPVQKLGLLSIGSLDISMISGSWKPDHMHQHIMCHGERFEAKTCFATNIWHVVCSSVSSSCFPLIPAKVGEEAFILDISCHAYMQMQMYTPNPSFWENSGSSCCVVFVKMTFSDG
jgi:hypothetical protein